MGRLDNFKHIKLTEKDKGILTVPKSLFHKGNIDLYNKMRLCIDALQVQDKAYHIYPMSSSEMTMLQTGGALMFQLMTNPDFLKECENIYKENGKYKEDKTDCVVCGSSYPNLKNDSDTCFSCREKQTLSSHR